MTQVNSNVEMINDGIHASVQLLQSGWEPRNSESDWKADADAMFAFFEHRSRQIKSVRRARQSDGRHLIFPLSHTHCP